MSTTLDEGKQRFVFDVRWRVFRYDDPASGYQALCEQIAGTKACDFAGWFDGRIPYLIEVKDFRGYRIENKRRLTQRELALEVAQKVRDTIAGIISGCRRSDSERPWCDLAGCLTASETEREVVVILCLEDDTSLNSHRWMAELKTQADLIKQKLNWLRVRVWAVSQSGNLHRLPGVTISNLSGAAGHAP